MSIPPFQNSCQEMGEGGVGKGVINQSLHFINLPAKKQPPQNLPPNIHLSSSTFLLVPPPTPAHFWGTRQDHLEHPNLYNSFKKTKPKLKNLNDSSLSLETPFCSEHAYSSRDRPWSEGKQQSDATRAVLLLLQLLTALLCG